MRNEFLRNDVLRSLSRSLIAAALGLGLACGAQAAATLQLLNGNAPGVGLNDPTAVAPLSSNPGTTLGQQRTFVLQEAARIWGETLTSAVPIQLIVGFVSLPCTANSAVLASAGPLTIFSDFAATARPATWYPAALANKLATADLTPGLGSIDDLDIIARFNVNLGRPGCLTGAPYYLGTDGKAPAGTVDLLTTVLHEFGHGLGFLSFADDTGARIGDPSIGFLPDVWEQFMFDRAQNKRWLDMTDAERAVSAISPQTLVWDGPNVKAASGAVLFGRPQLFVVAPLRGNRPDNYAVETASFGKQLDRFAVNVDQVGRVRAGNGLACTPLEPADRHAVRGRFAVVDRGSCPFVVKAKNVQDAGATGVIVANNVAGPPPPLGGSDPSVTIAVVGLSQADGTQLKADVDAVRDRFGGRVAVQGVLYRDPRQLSGADAQRRPFLFTPGAYQPGSSVSHYDSSAFPNLLMEPNASPNQAVAVRAPRDLTFELLRDIGW